jgi:hypothetical protein
MLILLQGCSVWQPLVWRLDVWRSQSTHMLLCCRRSGRGGCPEEEIVSREVNVHKTNSFFRPNFQFVSISKQHVIIYSR